MNVYNQAGRFLFNTTVSQNLVAGQTLPADLVSAFARQKHPLATTAMLKSETNHWWLADAGRLYFITPEESRLQVYFLDPDLTATLRLPQSTHAIAEQYLSMGSAPLRHEMRQGNKAASWYHGPLVPGKNNTTDKVSLPVRSADQLVRYNSDYGMFDVSYAAAWELGRLLALWNKRFSLDLSAWKRSHAQSRRMATHASAHCLGFEAVGSAANRARLARRFGTTQRRAVQLSRARGNDVAARVAAFVSSGSFVGGMFA